MNCEWQQSDITDTVSSNNLGMCSIYRLLSYYAFMTYRTYFFNGCGVVTSKEYAISKYLCVVSIFMLISVLQC